MIAQPVTILLPMDKDLALSAAQAHILEQGHLLAHSVLQATMVLPLDLPTRLAVEYVRMVINALLGLLISMGLLPLLEAVSAPLVINALIT